MVSLCFIIRLLHASHKVERSASKLYSMVAHQPLIVTISDQKMTWKANNDIGKMKVVMDDDIIDM